MKKHLLLTSIILLVTVVSQAQWQPEVRLTNNPSSSGTSFNNAWCIAANGDSVHVVWRDERDGNPEIYYKRSTDGGLSLGADTRLTNDPANSSLPSVTVSDSVVHVVWADDRDGNLEIYYKRSTDAGISWSADTRLTNDTNSSAWPSVSVTGQFVHVVWQDTDANGNQFIHYKRSTDGGNTWGADTSFMNVASNQAWRPSVTVSGTVVHIVWHESVYEICYKRSTDGGTSWGASTYLSNSPSDAFAPSVSVSGQVVHVAWSDNRDGNDEIYYKRSTDGGVSWGVDTRLTNAPVYSYYPSLSVSGQVVHVVWYDFRDWNDEIYYKRSTDGGISWGADTRLTNAPDVSHYPSVSVSGSVVHVVWSDYRDGNAEIYYKRDSIGNPVGIDESFLDQNASQFFPNPFSGSTVISFSLLQSQKVSLKIFDVNGRLVSTLADRIFDAGENELVWNAEEVNAGIYFLQFQSAENLKTEKLIVTKQ